MYTKETIFNEFKDATKKTPMKNTKIVATIR